MLGGCDKLLSVSECLECAAFRERSWVLSAQLRGVEDEMKLLRKVDPRFLELKAEAESVKGLIKDNRQRSFGHQQGHRK